MPFVLGGNKKQKSDKEKSEVAEKERTFVNRNEVKPSENFQTFIASMSFKATASICSKVLIVMWGPNRDSKS